MDSSSEPRRAPDKASIAPLIELCKAGRLFEVQEWIEQGKPVNAPPIPAKGTRTKSPLEFAIERGFHSLVQVLLQGGAVQEPRGYDSPMNRALRARRFDIVQLLVEHGFNPKSIDMNEVFATWDPHIMEYFIERGAEIQRGHPFARALCERIRTALRPFKTCRERVPELQEQANIALRHHCKEGNLKWVSLLLWAGADPLKPGTENPGEELPNRGDHNDNNDDANDDDDGGLSAMGFAALYDHLEIFELKPIRARLKSAERMDFVRYLNKRGGVNILKRLLEQGLNPNDCKDGGCSLIGSFLESMSWTYYYDPNPWNRDAASARKLDTPDARDNLKAIHLLVKHGAKWMPAERSEINSARRSLMKLTADYTTEFVWIMSKYQACKLESIESLLGTSTIKSHIVSHAARLREILASWNG
jgi:ankyrin repeat protein